MGAKEDDKLRGPYDVWYWEFGYEHEPPKLLKKWAARRGLTDTTWHNDEAPSYTFIHETGELRFWFDMTAALDQRFAVIFNPEDGGYVDIIQRTGSLDDAIAAFDETMARIEDGEVFTEETHQPPPPSPAHDWSPRKRS